MSGTQTGMLLFTLITATSILFVPGIIVQRTGQSAWLVTTFSCLTGIISLLIILKLSQRFPRTILSKYSEIVLGKVMGKVFCLAYVLFFFTTNTLTIREFSEFLSYSLSFGSSILLLIIVIVAVTGFGAYKGIEVIVRANQFVLPLFVISFVCLFGLALFKVDYERVLPLLEKGIQPLLPDSAVAASLFGEIVVLIMLLPIVNKPQEIWSKSLWAILASMGFITLCTLIIITVVGPNLSGHLLIPFWNFVKSIEYGNYVQRIEGIIFFFWLTIIMIKTTLLYYLTCLITAQVFGLKSYYPVICYLAPLQVTAATFMSSNTIQLQDIFRKYWPPFALFFEIALPLFLLTVAVIRKKRGS
ncbi:MULTISPECIES: endospore germination permease [unclassified Dehalobacter]|uniref:GerAB/ArcD/ProY family transporter n=1 Tax=unclassified Dehalobacter TaxID=2635733 RepID=UPI00210F6FEF|nr:MULTISPECIES: endospore germination permease [unclassified Dehalobacter]